MSTYGTGTYGHPGGIQSSDIAAIAAAVWNASLASFQSTGSTGEALEAAAQGGGGGGGGGVTAQQVWEYATRTLTLSLDPTTSQIASQVRTELATELGRIDVATSTRLASAAYTTPPTAASIRTEIDNNSTKLDVAVSTRLASVSYTAPDNATIGTINTKVQTLQNTDISGLATQASVNALGSPLQASSYTAPDNASISAIKAKTDNLPVNPVAVTDIPSASTVASQVRTELTTELGRIDVATSTRLASGDYTPPDNAGLNAKLDQKPSLASIEASSVLAKEATVNTKASQASVDALGTPLQSGTYVAPDNASISAIKAKTDNLPANPAASSDIIPASTIATAVNTELSGSLQTINNGVKNASILVPHTGDV